jgi:hypothetical protein
MPDFNVKDFWSYSDDPSTLKDLVLLVAKPGGGGFSLINMTKEEFFKIASTMSIEFTQTNGEIINFNDADGVSMNYLAGGKIIGVTGSNNFIFAETFGGNADIQIVNGATRSSIVLGGNSKDGFLRLLNTAGDETNIEATASIGLTTRLTDPRNENNPTTVNIQFREDQLFDFATVSAAGSTDIPQAYHSIYQANAAAGSISSHTFNMPEAVSGNIVRLAITGTITTVTMSTPGAETIDDPFTAAASAFQYREWIYDPGGVWRRIA